MVLDGVWRIRLGMFLGFGAVRTRCVAMISWVCWCKREG